MPLQGKVALVTGGTGALGQHVVRRFLDQGMRIHVPWIEEQETEYLKAFLGEDAQQVRLCQVDLASEPEVTVLVDSCIKADGRLDVVANIAGGFAFAAIEDTSFEIWNRMLTMNATTAFNCSRAAIPFMRKEKWGRIINVSAGPALNRGAASMSAYAASKAATLNLTQSLAAELVKEGITANAIVPTIIDTPANRKAMPDADTSTWLPPVQIAQVVGFLASEEAAIVTGSAITLSKG